MSHGREFFPAIFMFLKDESLELENGSSIYLLLSESLII